MRSSRRLLVVVPLLRSRTAVRQGYCCRKSIRCIEKGVLLDTFTPQRMDFLQQ